MKKALLVLLVLGVAATASWFFLRRAPTGSPPVEALPGALPEGWRSVTYGGALLERMEFTGEEFVVAASGTGLRATPPSFVLLARDVGVPLDAHARVLPDAGMGVGAGAGWMIRESGVPEAPFVSVVRDHEGRMRVEASASMDIPAISRTVKNAEGLEYLRIIVDGVVLKASCSRDGVNWPVAENITAPWLTNHPIVGLVVFSGDDARASSARFRDVTFQSLPPR